MNEIEEENEIFLKEILSNSKKILFFCQAPADIQYILHFIQNCNKDCEIHIKIINVQGMFHFFKYIALKKTKLQFIPYKYNLLLNDLISILKTKIYLKKLYNNSFRKYEEFDVFFFSHLYDYISFYFISKLKKSNRIFFINHYDDLRINECSKYQSKFKKGIIKLIYYIITGINFLILDFENEATIEFPFTKYNISEIKYSYLDSAIYEKYSYTIGEKRKEKRLLILENNFDELDFFEEYIQTTLKILKIISEKYEVFIKPHPRLGYSKFLKNHIKNEIPMWVPAEFINFNDFDIVLGISSTALNIISTRINKPVISLSNLYKWKNDKKRQNWNKNASEKIILFEKLSDLRNFLK
jgi:hypothetical protein